MSLQPRKYDLFVSYVYDSLGAMKNEKKITKKIADKLT